MSLPIFVAAMFDFGTYEVPHHVEEGWLGPADDTWTVLDGIDSDSATAVAWRIPTIEMAELLAQARTRKSNGEAWIVDPSDCKTRVLTDAAIFDIAGSRVEQKMASSYRTLSSIPINSSELERSRYAEDGSNPKREEH